MSLDDHPRESLWVHSFSFPGSPRSAPVRSNSFDCFDGAHPGKPQVPCLWSGSLGDDLSYMPSPREGERDRSFWSGAHPIEWAPRGRHREAKRMHPVYSGRDLSLGPGRIKTGAKSTELRAGWRNTAAVHLFVITTNMWGSDYYYYFFFFVEVTFKLNIIDPFTI